jgi:type IV fimbrial biogenesis protein FimT
MTSISFNRHLARGYGRRRAQGITLSEVNPLDGMLAKTRAAGFTLMEMLITIAIVTILATIAIPGFKYVTASNRIATEINGLLGDLQFARSEAIKEGETVTVCIANANGSNCSTTAAGAWQNGWIVFLDSNGDHQVQTGEAILRVQPAFTGTDTFLAGGTPTALSWVTYNRMGYAPTGSVSTINFSLHSAPVTSSWTRCLAVSPIGSAVTEKYGTGTPACT